MNNKLLFALPILVAMAGIAIPSAFAQTTTTTGGTTTTTTTPDHDHHHFFGGGFGARFGLGGGVTILNPASTSNVVCTNPAFPVPTSNGYCLSIASAGTDVQEGYVTAPTTAPIIIQGYSFGGLGGFGFHHFHFRH